MLLSVLMFAIIVGHISTMVNSAALHRTQFQRVRDSIKLYLQTRWIPVRQEKDHQSKGPPRV